VSSAAEEAKIKLASSEKGENERAGRLQPRKTIPYFILTMSSSLLPPALSGGGGGADS
jgi:hypothetical protein